MEAKEAPRGSFKDSRGYLYVNCAECQRGGNGDRDCSAGWKKKRVDRGGCGCFAGQLLDKYDPDKACQINGVRD